MNSRALHFVLLTFGVLLVGLPGCKTVESTAEIDEDKLAKATSFDYADWIYSVETYVNDKGQVDYPKLLADREPLDRFVATIGKVGPKSRPELFKTKQQKLAYYINAYNALTMFNVINRYPKIESVVTDQLSFFVSTKFPLDGDKSNLYDLENKIVRPTFNDPRVHFALNCASGGCPVLPNKIFAPEGLEAQLDDETQKFLHLTRNVALEDGKVVLSEILKWYAEDFKPDPLTWVRKTAPDLNLPEGAEVAHRPYDWTLNDSSRIK